MRQTEENIEKDWNHSKQGKKKSLICSRNTVLHFLRVGTSWGEHLYAQNGWNEEIHKKRMAMSHVMIPPTDVESLLLFWYWEAWRTLDIFSWVKSWFIYMSHCLLGQVK